MANNAPRANIIEGGAPPLFGQVYEAEAVADFIIAHGFYPHGSRKEILAQVLRHAEYATGMVIMDGGPKAIIASARWNYDDPWTVRVLDCTVHRDYRHQGLPRLMLKSFLSTHPTVRRIVWERLDSKYPGRSPTVICRKELVA